MGGYVLSDFRGHLNVPCGTRENADERNLPLLIIISRSGIEALLFRTDLTT